MGAIEDLRLKAGDGDVEAMTRLGVELVMSQAASGPPEGVAMIARAADGGGAEAAHLQAVFAAMGYLRPQSWPDAIDLLRQSAARGFQPARDELALLQGEDGTVDVAAWTQPRGRRYPLCEDPRIGAIEGFASPELCDWLIERARPRLKRARIYGLQDAEAAVHSKRTNREATFNVIGLDIVQVLLRARMGGAIGLPPQAMESLVVLNYQPGEEFRRHFDFLVPGAPGTAEQIARSGQRVATFLIYLNDDYEGGETEFPLLGLRHRGRRGDALVFSNVDRAREPHRKTLHAGLPPRRGEKWLMSQWIRDRMPKVFARPASGAQA